MTTRRKKMSLGVKTDELHPMIRHIMYGEEDLPPVFPGEAFPLNDNLQDEADGPEAEADFRLRLKLVCDAVNEFQATLPGVEEAVFRRRLLGEETLHDIGADFDLSRERIRQHECLLYCRFRRFLLAKYPDIL